MKCIIKLNNKNQEIQIDGKKQSGIIAIRLVLSVNKRYQNFTFYKKTKQISFGYKDDIHFDIKTKTGYLIKGSFKKPEIFFKNHKLTKIQETTIILTTNLLLNINFKVESSL